MNGAFLVALLAGGGPIEAEPRQVLEVAVNAPAGELGAASISELIDALDRHLRRHTDLRPVEIPVDQIRECAGSIECIAGVARARSVLVVSSAPREGSDQFSAMWIDVRSAKVRMRTPWTSVRNVDSWIEGLVTKALQPELERGEHWEPYGSIRVRADPPAATVLVDGRTLGVSGDGTHDIRTTGGPYRIEVVHAGYDPLVQTVDVERGGAVSVDAVLTPSGVSSRALVGWTGVGVAAVGAVFTIWSIAYASANADIAIDCTYAAGASECGGGSELWTLEQIVRGRPEVGRGADTNAGVVYGLPFGYSLVAAGGITALGAWLFGDDRSFPWWPVLSGVIVGGTAYTVTALAQGS